eukprot:NODE_37_length_35953_cov_1.028037.p10 type:complete len:158 gc:universal NODE_37_length_35953_cov_1.028037:5210-4737(-)
MWLKIFLSLFLYAIALATIFTTDSVESKKWIYFGILTGFLVVGNIGILMNHFWKLVPRERSIGKSNEPNTEESHRKMQRERGELSNSRSNSFNPGAYFTEEETKDLREQVEMILKSPKVLLPIPIAPEKPKLDLPKDRKMNPSSRKPSTEPIFEVIE